MLPSAVGNPAVGLAVAGGVVGGVAIAGVGAGVLIASAVDAYAAYKAAMAAYSAGAALGTGAAISGSSYTGIAVIGAISDATNGANFINSFYQRFSVAGLGAAMTVGSLTGVYDTAMFGWAGIPNTIKNWGTVSGFVIRVNSGMFGNIAGQAAPGAVKSSSNP